LDSYLESKTIKVGENDIHYLTGGNGKPLVVVHGGGGGSTAWLRTAAELSDYYRVYVPDLPGFGKSKSEKEKFDLSDFVAFIEDFSKSLGLDDFHLVGHSIGGCIALLYALEFPHRPSKLVLISSMCLGKEIALWIRFLSRSAFQKSFGEAAIAFFTAIKWLGRRLNAPFRFNSPLSRLKIDIGRSTTTLKGQATIVANQLSELVMPTLLIWGADDKIIPPRHAYAAAEVIPDCQVNVLDGGGHHVHTQKTAEFSEIMTSFLG